MELNEILSRPFEKEKILFYPQCQVDLMAPIHKYWRDINVFIFCDSAIDSGQEAFNERLLAELTTDDLFYFSPEKDHYTLETDDEFPDIEITEFRFLYDEAKLIVRYFHSHWMIVAKYMIARGYKVSLLYLDEKDGERKFTLDLRHFQKISEDFLADCFASCGPTFVDQYQFDNYLMEPGISHVLPGYEQIAHNVFVKKKG